MSKLEDMEARLERHEAQILLIQKDFSYMREGIDQIKKMLEDGYVTKMEQQKLAERVAIVESKIRGTSDIITLIRNIIVTALVVGIIGLLGWKASV